MHVCGEETRNTNLNSIRRFDQRENKEVSWWKREIMSYLEIEFGDIVFRSGPCLTSKVGESILRLGGS